MMDQNKLWRFTKIVLNVTMGLIYILIGFFVTQKQWFMTALDKNLSYALAAVLIVYGLFRIYRVVKTSKE